MGAFRVLARMKIKMLPCLPVSCIIYSVYIVSHCTLKNFWPSKQYIYLIAIQYYKLHKYVFLAIHNWGFIVNLEWYFWSLVLQQLVNKAYIRFTRMESESASGGTYLIFKHGKQLRTRGIHIESWVFICKALSDVH